MSRKTIDIEIEGEEIEVTAKWDICDNCDGEGKHLMESLRGVAYTREEFDESFAPEEQESYFNGGYDQYCKTCQGAGKILVPDEGVMSRELLDRWHKELDNREYYARERESELRWGY